MKNLFLLISLAAAALCNGQDIVAHDPVMIRTGETYYLFCTGPGISVFSSADMRSWQKEKPVFEKAPEWAVNAVPGFKNHIWAPDISFHNGTYYLYYSVSAFGKNTSCIGVATNKSLDPDSKDYRWIDHGKVIQSVPGRDLWNAIDPNLARDENDHPWLAFGSFWSGIKLVRLDSSLQKIAQPEEWRTLSKRERSFRERDEEAGPGSVEAPFIFRRNGFYYLFVSFDFCCRGRESTYKVVVGRAKKITGPYLDKSGVRMDEGGGSLVLAGSERWAGVGHNAIYTFDGVDYLIYHAYDSSDNGKPKLQIRTVSWQDDWPVAGD